MTTYDIDVSKLASQLTKFANRDMHNLSDTADAVIDFGRYTSDNHIKWYRLYKSGWIEQGGFYDHGSLVKDWPAVTVSYPKQMLDTTYTLLTQAGRNDAATGSINNQSFVTFRDTTQFIAEVYGDGTSQFLWWKVEGYAKTI